MKINTANLKTEVTKLNKLITNYEETFLNLYNELSLSSNYWEDNTSKLFTQKVTTEKLEVKNTITELNDLKEIYEYLITKYEELGNKIEIFPQTKTSILSKFNNYIEKISETIKLYQELNLDFCPKEAKKILKHLEKLQKFENDIIILKEKVKKHFEQIEEIEKEVNLKISKLKIEYINESGIDNFI